MSPEVKDRSEASRAAAGAVGAFIAVVGPSGAGKDTILSLARRSFRPEEPVRFARRVVTRIAQVEAEDHDCLDPPDFLAAERAGAFCLTWQAHGLSYGLPAGLVADCLRGRTVVANVSRRALLPAAERFPALHVVEVTAPRPLLVRRIAARGREGAAEIEARLARSVDLQMPSAVRGRHAIDNSGEIEAAVQAFVSLVRSLMPTAGIQA